MKNNQQITKESLAPSSLGRNEKEDSLTPGLASRSNLIIETLVGSILIAIVILILNPMDFWMPDMAHVTALTMLLVVFVLYASFILREKARDERDVLHRMFAARAAFFTGTALLTLGVFFGALKGDIDMWLVISLVGMILAKLVARFYSDKNL